MEESQHAEQVAEVVVVRLAGSRYAVPMPAIAEVGRPPGLTRVPGLPSWVAGLANWRGRVLAVLDLRPLLSAPGASAPVPSLDRKARLVVLHRGDVRVGLLIEGVDGTVELGADRLEPAPGHLHAAAGALLAGQVTDAAGPLGVLDLDALLGLADSLPRARRAS